MIGVGLALFAGFALFFEGVLGISGEPIANLDEVLPYAVIGLGVLLVVLSLPRRRPSRGAARTTPRAAPADGSGDLEHRVADVAARRHDRHDVAHLAAHERRADG